MKSQRQKKRKRKGGKRYLYVWGYRLRCFHFYFFFLFFLKRKTYSIIWISFLLDRRHLDKKKSTTIAPGLKSLLTWLSVADIMNWLCSCTSLEAKHHPSPLHTRSVMLTRRFWMFSMISRASTCAHWTLTRTPSMQHQIRCVQSISIYILQNFLIYCTLDTMHKWFHLAYCF